MAERGILEVVEAVAAVSGLVTVTLLGNGEFTVVPNNLLDRQFNDPGVGIDDDRMPDFIEALRNLLEGEGIDDTINQLPEISNVRIGKIATIINLALTLAAAHRNVLDE